MTVATARRAGGAVLAILTLAYTLVIWVVPELRFSWYSPPARVVIETLGLCVALVAVLALLMPDDGDRLATRNAFVTSLLVMGVSNLVFGVGPLLAGEPANLRGLPSFYPWLAARYLVGALFIAAGLGKLRLTLRWYLTSVAVLLLIVDRASSVLRARLPAPFVELEFTPGGVLVPVSSPAQVLVIAVLPGLLFGVGCWLALRTYRGGASEIYAWLSAALAVQALGKVHEVLYSTVLGPVVTSADLFRVVFLMLLLAGALFKVRQVVVDRGVAVAALEEDLRSRERHLEAMREFTEREQRFRSLVVHELGTPIATLRTFAHVLVDGARADADSERSRTAARGVEAESTRLQELVDRMEQLRDFEGEDFRAALRPVRLRPLLEDAAAYVRGLHGGHEPTLEWECGDVRVRADPGLLGQALRNVLSNAARYSPSRSPILIGCRSVGARVEVAVTDRGPGIRPDERERVLTRFERGSAGQGTRGTGLGLYVAARVAQSHGGRLVLSDAEGGAGTRVVFELERAD